MSRPRPKLSAAHLRRPTLETKFHIDYDWWDRSDLDLRTYLFSRLDIGEDSPFDMGVEYVDLVDPDTAEVRQVDGFQFALQTYFSKLPEDFASQSSLVDGVFYLLLANANKPMSANELADKVDRDPELVLKTLSGSRIYQGIKPILSEDS